MPKRQWGPFTEDDSEILVDLRTLIEPVTGLGISLKQTNLEIDKFMYQWCEDRHIELLWRVPPHQLVNPSAYLRPQMSWTLSWKSLLVFRNPQDKMLFKLYFNSDA